MGKDDGSKLRKGGSVESSMLGTDDDVWPGPVEGRVLGTSENLWLGFELGT